MQCLSWNIKSIFVQIKNNPLRRGELGINPSAYSLIVIRCRISYDAKVCVFFDLTNQMTTFV